MSDFSGNSSNTDDDTKPVKKMPYFHRTLSPEETAIIGDITPKQIEATVAVGSQEPAVVKMSTSSSWNAAGTWESRNCSDWAKTELEGYFKGVSATANGYAMEVQKCDGVEGTAEIVHTRGKIKYIYDFVVTLKLAVTQQSTDTTWKATLTVESVMTPDLEDSDWAVTWTGAGPTGPTLTSVRKLLLKEGALRDAMIEKMKAFHSAFEAL